MASVFSYLYIFCISLCANCLVWLCLLALVAIPTCLGLMYVYMSASPEIVVPNSFPGTITTGDTQYLAEATYLWQAFCDGVCMFFLAKMEAHLICFFFCLLPIQFTIAMVSSQSFQGMISALDWPFVA